MKAVHGITKSLQQFLGLINYARPFLQALHKLSGPLYSKLSLTGVKKFNTEDYKQIDKIRQMVETLPLLKLPLDSDYLTVQTDGSEYGWGAILLRKPHKYSTETICRYASGKFREKNITSSIDQELLAVCYGLDAFRLFLLNKKEILVRTDCEAIVKFFHTKNEKRISQKRWLSFTDHCINNAYRITFEHIRGKENVISDILSRLLQRPN